MMYGNGTWGWGMWVGMGLLTLAVLIVFAGATVLVLRAVHGRPGENALTMLDQRLAAGQVTPAEYSERKRLLDATYANPATR